MTPRRRLEKVMCVRSGSLGVRLRRLIHSFHDSPKQASQKGQQFRLKFDLAKFLMCQHVLYGLSVRLPVISCEKFWQQQLLTVTTTSCAYISFNLMMVVCLLDHDIESPCTIIICSFTSRIQWEPSINRHLDDHESERDRHQTEDLSFSIEKTILAI